MRAVKTRVFDATVLTVALVLPSCSFMPKKGLAPSLSEWLDKPSDSTFTDPLVDNHDPISKNESASAGASHPDVRPEEIDMTTVPEALDAGAEEISDLRGEETPAEEATGLKAALPGAEESGDQIRVLLVSSRLNVLEPQEDHWAEVKQDAEKFLGSAAEPSSMEKSIRNRLAQAQKDRRAAEAGRGKDSGDLKLERARKSLMEELSRREGRALSASVHITVLDEERGRLMAKLEEGKTPDLLSQLKKANESRARWQNIVASEKSETERINSRLVELNSALKGREQDLKDAREKRERAWNEEVSLRRDLELMKGWRADFSRRQKNELKAQRKKEKEQIALVEKSKVPLPATEFEPLDEAPVSVQDAPSAVKPLSVDSRPISPEDITLGSFDPSAPLDKILSKFTEPSHQRAALNLLLWKMSSNDPRRADAMKRLVALRGNRAVPIVPPAETFKEVRGADISGLVDPPPAVEKDVVMLPAPMPVREAVVVPASARQRLLSGSGKTSIPPNAFHVPDQKKDNSLEKRGEVFVDKMGSTEKREKSAVREKSREEQSPEAAVKESSVRALEKLLQTPPPESWEVEPQVEEKVLPPAVEGSPKEAAVSPSAIVVYRVKTGDTLPALAKEIYGDSARWQEIYEANQNVILRGLLEPGQWLLIPRGMAR